MDQNIIIDTLGLISGGTFTITDVQMAQWGREVVFSFDYHTQQPDGTPDELVRFQLVFKDCRELRWKTYAHIALAETGTVSPRTELAEISLGKGSHRRDASLLTNHFAVNISYGHISLERDEGSFPLAN